MKKLEIVPVKGTPEAALPRLESLSKDQLAKHANAAAREAEGRALHFACVSGLFLLQARAKCEADGTGWYEWLENEWHYSRKTADRFIKLAEACGRDLARVGTLGATTIRGALSVIGQPVSADRKSESKPRKHQENKEGDRTRVSDAPPGGAGADAGTDDTDDIDIANATDADFTVHGPPDEGEDRSGEQDVDDLDDTPEDQDDEAPPAAAPAATPVTPAPPPAAPASVALIEENNALRARIDALPTTAPVLLLAAPGTGLGGRFAPDGALVAPGPPPTAAPFLDALARASKKGELASTRVADLAQLRAAQALALLVEAGIYRLAAKESTKAPGRVDTWDLGDELDKLVCRSAKRFEEGAAKDELVKALRTGLVAGGPPALASYQHGLELARKPTSTDLIREQVLDETHPFLRPAMRSSCAASPEQTTLLLVRDLWSRLDGLVGALKTVRVPRARVEGLSTLRDLVGPAIDAATALVRTQHGADAPEPRAVKVGGKKKAKDESCDDKDEA